MNYLGHLYFSNNNPELMVANLYGDYVKGSKLDRFSVLVQRGIRLHRAIDNFIDTHPDVLALNRNLYEELPKVSGIAVDLFFDHLLARNWSIYHDMPYIQFLERFYAHQIISQVEYTEDFLKFIEAMRTHDWLSHYPSSYGLLKSCQGVSRKLSFPNLLDTGADVFKKNEDEITQCFKKYMHDARFYFKI
ncbi:MAG: ACP phosphodiesterase [Cryomorphaceae bacterium]|nr:ACP phosphodiesterase [Cryomorphaceae bacterium]